MKYLNLKKAAIVFFVIALVFLCMGYNKMYRYSNPEHFGKSINVYVGGDAYNYIINANYATGFFTLGTGCMLTGTVFLCTYLILDEKCKHDVKLQKPKNGNENLTENEEIDKNTEDKK